MGFLAMMMFLGFLGFISVGLTAGQMATGDVFFWLAVTIGMMVGPPCLFGLRESSSRPGKRKLAPFAIPPREG